MAVTFEHVTLDNGLVVIGEVDPHAHSAAIGFFVNTGARDEAPAAMGVSHFLEHMMFKGTERRTAEDVDRDFDAIGADHNAFTTSELTAFHAHCLPEHLPVAEEVLADIMRPSIRPADFDAEKQVIIEEIAMYEDQPIWVLYERAMEEYYGDHPLAHRVLGTRETVSGLERDAMARYFAERYSADNTVVALAGRIDFAAMTDRIRGHCGDWARTGAKRAHAAAPHPPKRFAMQLPTVHRHYALMVSPAPALQDPRRHAAAMLAQILGDQEGSRLYWSLVETGLAEDAVAQYEGRDGLGEYVVYCVCSPDDAERVTGIVQEQMHGLADSLTEDDLLRTRRKIATAATIRGELPAGRMKRLGRLWTALGEYRSLEDEIARIESVTLDELREVASEYPITDLVHGSLAPGA